MQPLELVSPASWPKTIALAPAWLTLMLAYSPLADQLATRLVSKPPNLSAFRAQQQSRSKLLLGIVIAWVVGGLLEELVFREIILQWVEAYLSARLAAPLPTGIAVCAGVGAGVVHLYQGPRAAIIITQLPVLFGLLFVVSGHDLWAVILCHGMHDRVGFFRFGKGRSRYSSAEGGP